MNSMNLMNDATWPDRRISAAALIDLKRTDRAVIIRSITWSDATRFKNRS